MICKLKNETRIFINIEQIRTYLSEPLFYLEGYAWSIQYKKTEI